MKIKMTTNKSGRDNSVNAVREFVKGTVYDLTDKELADVFLENGWAVEVDENDAPVGDAEITEQKDVVLSEADAAFLKDADSKTLADLHKFAKKHKVSLNGITRKDDVVAALQLAFPAKEETTEEGDKKPNLLD